MVKCEILRSFLFLIHVYDTCICTLSKSLAQILKKVVRNLKSFNVKCKFTPLYSKYLNSGMNVDCNLA